MATTKDLITETIGLLQSWSLDSEQVTSLQGSMTASDLSFTVSSTRGAVTGVTPGIVEIDQELLYVDTVANNGVATITPWGRGHLATVPVAHADGSKVISQPTFPRYHVLTAINEAIQRVYPKVFAVKQFETVTTFPSITYPMPADSEKALGAKWQSPGGGNYWVGVQKWRNSQGGGTLIGDSVDSIDIGDSMLVGRPLQIQYMAKPSPLVTEADDFVTTTGLSIGMRDVICLGAAAQLTTSQELSRLQMSSIEQQNRSQLVAPSAALTSSRFLEQKFQTRLAEEEVQLQQIYPPRVVRTWR